MSILTSSSTAIQTLNPTRGIFALGVLAGVCLLGTTGCYAEVETRPAYVTYSATATARPVVVQEEEDVVYEESPAVEIESYPTVVYAGRPCYWVDGRWYYRGPRGWAYYRTEPRGLVTHRVEFERRYPEGFHAHVNAHVDAHVGGEAHAGGHVHAAPVHEEVRRVEVARPTVRENVRVNEHVTVKAGGKASVRSSSKDRR